MWFYDCKEQYICCLVGYKRYWFCLLRLLLYNGNNLVMIISGRRLFLSDITFQQISSQIFFLITDIYRWISPLPESPLTYLFRDGSAQLTNVCIQDNNANSIQIYIFSNTLIMEGSRLLRTNCPEQTLYAKALFIRAQGWTPWGQLPGRCDSLSRASIYTSIIVILKEYNQYCWKIY